MLDHPSLSRQHAVVCYHRLNKVWVVLDLSSAHGTKADGKLVAQVSGPSIRHQILTFKALFTQSESVD